jgi:hypothetical protein
MSDTLPDPREGYARQNQAENNYFDAIRSIAANKMSPGDTAMFTPAIDSASVGQVSPSSVRGDLGKTP